MTLGLLLHSTSVEVGSEARGGGDCLPPVPGIGSLGAEGAGRGGEAVHEGVEVVPRSDSPHFLAQVSNSRHGVRGTELV